MSISLRSILSAMLLLLLAFALINPAAEARKRQQREFPHGCEQVGFSFMNDHLNLKPEVEEGDQTLYLFGNKTGKKIYIKYIELGDAFMVPDWHTVMKNNHWSAFATDKKQLYFQCSEVSQKGRLTPTNCQQVLRICQYPRAKFASHNMGNYWVSQDKPRRAVIREAVRTGILLRW